MHVTLRSYQRESDLAAHLEAYERCRIQSLWHPKRDIAWNRRSTLDERRAHVALVMAQEQIYGEQVGMMIGTRLLAEVEDLPTRLCLAGAVADEARHVEVFAEYVRRNGGDIERINAGPDMLMLYLNAMPSHLDRFIAHTFLESMATDQFLILMKAFEGDPASEMYALVRKDEARHVSMGLEYLRHAFREVPYGEAFDRLVKIRSEICALVGMDEASYSGMGALIGLSGSAVHKMFDARFAARIKLALSQTIQHHA